MSLEEIEKTRATFEEKAFAMRFLASVVRNPSPPQPKISGALDFVSQDCPNKAAFIRRDENGDYLDKTLDCMWWGWREGLKSHG